MQQTGYQNGVKTFPMKQNAFNEDGECKKEEYTPLSVIVFRKERVNLL